MAGFSVTVDDRQVTAALAALSARLGNLKAPLAEAGQTLVTLADLAFRNQQDPWGRAWQRLAASTLKRRRKGPGRGAGQILRDTGRLQNSISYRADAHSVTVGTNVVYAAIHQFGGDLQRQARTATLYFKQRKDGTVGTRFVRRSRSDFAQDVQIAAHTVTMPRRAFLPISAAGRIDLPAATLAEILDGFRRHLDAAR